MRSDAASEASLSGEAPQALPVEGVLNPYNCGEHDEVRMGPPAGTGKGVSCVLCVSELFKLLFAGPNLSDITRLIRPRAAVRSLRLSWYR